MARPIDLSSLTGPERTVLIGGAALLVDCIVPWWYRVHTSAGSLSYNAGLTGLGIVAAIAGAVAMIAVLARASIWPEPAPARDGALYVTLGVVGAGAIIIEIARAHHTWIGPYVGFVCALVIASGGIRRRARRKAGWT